MQFIQTEQAEPALAIVYLPAYQRRDYAAANRVGVIAGARHRAAIERARPNHQVRSRLFRYTKQAWNILRQMLAVAIQSDHMGIVLGAREFDAQTQRRGLAAIPGRSQTCSSR